MLRKISCAALSFLLILAFTGCLLPEKFSCDVVINADGSYSVSYKGTVIDYRVLSTMSEGSLTDQDFVSFVEAYEESGYFTSVKKADKNRMNVEYSKSVSDGSPLEVFEGAAFIQISVVSGSIQIKFAQVDAQTKTWLDSAGYKIDGKVTITSEIPVIQSGANKVAKAGKNVIIRKTFKELPDSAEILIFANDVTKNMKAPDTRSNSQRVSSDWLE